MKKRGKLVRNTNRKIKKNKDNLTNNFNFLAIIISVFAIVTLFSLAGLHFTVGHAIFTFNQAGLSNNLGGGNVGSGNTGSEEADEGGIIEVPLPDYITEISPNLKEVGNYYHVMWTTKNVGKEDAKKQSGTKLFIKKYDGKKWITYDTWLRGIPALKVGESVQHSPWSQLPCGKKGSGIKYELWAKADYQEVIKESSEDNNHANVILSCP